jgi:hypothetical protein
LTPNLGTVCQNFNQQEIENYLKRRKCGGTVGVANDYCCQVAVTQTCSGPCNAPPPAGTGHLIEEVGSYESQYGTCSDLGTTPDPVVINNDLAVIAGKCFQGKCNFTVNPPCEKSCEAVEDHCRRFECIKANPPDGFPCPGALILITNGCGCPEPGFQYQGCPGSEVGGSPPFTLTGNPEIRLVSLKINNEEVCLPILCEGNCDGYTFCE